MFSRAAFRHDPIKSVLAGASPAPVLWTHEPAICGYRRMTYHNTKLAISLPVPISSSPVIIAGLGMLIASDDGYLRFFDQSLNKVFWERRLNTGVYASLILDAKRKHVIVAGTGGLVVCFDLRGKTIWSADLGVAVFATPAILPESDVLIVAAFQSCCFGLNVATGERIFHRHLPKPWHASVGGSAAHRDPYASPAITADGTAILCCAEHVLCIEADGNELWRYDTGHTIKSSPAVLHKRAQVAVCTVDGRCVFLDTRSGLPRGEIFLAAKITASPALSGDILAIGTQCDSVTALNGCTHQIVWTSQQGAPCSYTSFSVLPDGNFIATGSRGNIICLRREDGRFLWETSQVLGLPDHEPEMDITPIASPDGGLYCASFSGMLYYFRFQPKHPEVVRCS